MSNIGPKFILDDRFSFDPTSNSLVDKEADDEIVRLGSNESRILLMLSQRPNEVVTRNELHDFVWREQGFEVDDSSLTQAISTLRKNLKDSTKSPQFVKTVPKRGYQLICNVNIINEELAELPLDDIDTHDKAEPVDIEETTSVKESLPDSQDVVIHHDTNVTEPDTAIEVSSNSLQNDENQTSVNQKKSKRSDLLTKVMIVLAILLPIVVLIGMGPTPSEFRDLTSYNGIEVTTATNQPDLSEWLPSIKLCIDSYTKRHTDSSKATKIIATAGQDNVLVLNYIHVPEDSDDNFTVRILANQSDLTKICR